MKALILAQAANGGSGMSMIVMMIAIFAIMYFFMIRPQQKKQKEIRKFQDNLIVGSEVYTQGGIVGKVISINWLNNTVVIESGKTQFVVYRYCVYSNAPAQQ